MHSAPPRFLFVLQNHPVTDASWPVIGEFVNSGSSPVNWPIPKAINRVKKKKKGWEEERRGGVFISTRFTRNPASTVTPRNLPLVVRISSTMTLCNYEGEIYPERNLRFSYYSTIYSLRTTGDKFGLTKAPCRDRYHGGRYVYFLLSQRLRRFLPYVERATVREEYWNVRGVRNEYPFWFRLYSTPSSHNSLPPPQFHGCNCDLLFRELAFKVSTLKVFHAWYHPLIEFKTDA